MRTHYLFGVLILAIGAYSYGADDPSSTKDVSSREAESNDLVQTVVHSARLGEIDPDTAVYRSYTNTEINNKLNQIAQLTAYERRELLSEVHRRIERDGEFKVEKHERSFGKVVSAEPEATNDVSEELVLEDIVIHRVDSSEEEMNATREEARKSRPPVRRLSSGRSYSSQQ